MPCLAQCDGLVDVIHSQFPEPRAHEGLCRKIEAVAVAVALHHGQGEGARRQVAQHRRSVASQAPIVHLDPGLRGGVGAQGPQHPEALPLAGRLLCTALSALGCRPAKALGMARWAADVAAGVPGRCLQSKFDQGRELVKVRKHPKELPAHHAAYVSIGAAGLRVALSNTNDAEPLVLTFESGQCHAKQSGLLKHMQTTAAGHEEAACHAYRP